MRSVGWAILHFQSLLLQGTFSSSASTLRQRQLVLTHGSEEGTVV